MKTFQLFLVDAIIACASAFALMPQQRTAVVSQLAAAPKFIESFADKKAAIAAFATAFAPVVAVVVVHAVLKVALVEVSFVAAR